MLCSKVLSDRNLGQSFTRTMTCLFFSSVVDRVDYKEVRGFSGIVFLKLPFTMEPVIKASNE